MSDDLDRVVQAAQSGDLDAFQEVVRRFQDMAVGYAYSVLGDFHQAEDAAQDAFLAVWETFDALRDAEAFPGWFRRIVFTCCTRRTRAVRPTVAGDALEALPADTAHPLDALEDRVLRDRLLDTVDGLPDEERAAVTLFYLGDYTHAQIADFLDLSRDTVNNRLRSARERLKTRMVDVARQALRNDAPSRDDGFVNAVGICNAARSGDLARVVRILAADPKLARAAHAQKARGPLHYAAREGHAEIARRLIEAGANPVEGIYPNREATTPLALARDRGHREVVDVIEAWLHDERGTTALGVSICAAAGRGDVELVGAILAESPEAVSATNRVGETALHHAAARGHRDLVALLADAGADPNTRSARGERPIHLALFKRMGGVGFQVQPADPEMARLLIDKGAEVDIWVAAALGDTPTVRNMLAEDRALAAFHNGVATNNPAAKVFPLFIAAYNGHLEVVRLLLDHGADPDARTLDAANDRDRGGWQEKGAPLLAAILEGHEEVALLLLDRGADCLPPNVNGMAKIPDAAYASTSRRVRDRVFLAGGRPMVFTYVKHADYLMIGELLDAAAGGDGEGRCDAGEVLRHAMYFGDPRLVSMCLEHDPQLTDEEWFDTVWQALRWFEGSHEGKIEGLRLAFAHGVSPNLRAGENESFLHRTQGTIYRDGRWNNTEEQMIGYSRVLLDAGADIDAVDDEMRTTPLGLHARYGHRRVVEFLLERGASVDPAGCEPWSTPLALAESNGHDGVAALLRDAQEKASAGES